jgi:2-amino-4-hydroxy-6-hydroxymethyldihydropteridine diphosphokinase / dihydropteroate synthase
MAMLIDQIRLNGDISPLQLLAKLQDIENRMGRKKIIDKGPRNIDLDLLLYGHNTWHSEELIVPHKLMLEREFVLRPLCDLIPDQKHPFYPDKTYLEHLNSLEKDQSMSTVTPYGQSGMLRTSELYRTTRIMSILNLTPDSFSDGGRHSPEPGETISTIRDHVKSGVDILDVGGQSTRPKAPMVSAVEEMSRVIPMIDQVRSDLPQLNISIDTFRHEVAKEALIHGASIINDVSAGTLDSKMFETIAKHGCTCVLMHMRGDPSNMMRHTNYPDGLVATIAKELLERVAAAEAAGIRRWRIILDPGIGFAKTEKHNLEILRRLNDLRQWPGLQGFPWLIGASRKGFIGRITGVTNPSERKWGTAAAVTAAVQGGADIVRVHDVEEMAKVVKMADAIWRS